MVKRIKTIKMFEKFVVPMSMCVFAFVVGAACFAVVFIVTNRV